MSTVVGRCLAAPHWVYPDWRGAQSASISLNAGIGPWTRRMGAAEDPGPPPGCWRRELQHPDRTPERHHLGSRNADVRLSAPGEGRVTVEGRMCFCLCRGIVPGVCGMENSSRLPLAIQTGGPYLAEVRR